MKALPTEAKTGVREACTRCGRIRYVKYAGRPGALCADCRYVLPEVERRAWRDGRGLDGVPIPDDEGEDDSSSLVG